MCKYTAKRHCTGFIDRHVWARFDRPSTQSNSITVIEPSAKSSSCSPHLVGTHIPPLPSLKLTRPRPSAC